MGTDFALACSDCYEFISLHKWSILNYYSLPSKRFPSLSSRLVVPVTSQQLIDSLKDFVPPQQWIEKLLPVVNNFVISHQSHFLFLTDDIGEQPWDFGEPQYLEWKEIQAKCAYSGQFLPRNLIEDFGFCQWSQVLEYYSQHELWFLHEQMAEETEALKQAFCRGVCHTPLATRQCDLFENIVSSYGQTISISKAFPLNVWQRERH